jgi:hypothetical protein
METLDDNDLIQTLELAEQIGCEEPFLFMLIKEVKRRDLQYIQSTNFNQSLPTLINQERWK